jgi:hypothetical protein
LIIPSKGVETLGYREYAKDFEIEYVERPGKKRPKAVRIYVGPYFQLKVSAERVRWLKRFYLACLLACAALLLNALKQLAGVDDEVHLIAPTVIDPIQHLKVDHLGNRNPRLHTDEVLLALSICAATDPAAEAAMEQLEKLRGCQVHSSVILSPVDEKVFKRLGIHLTCQPQYKA